MIKVAFYGPLLHSFKCEEIVAFQKWRAISDFQAMIRKYFLCLKILPPYSTKYVFCRGEIICSDRENMFWRLYCSMVTYNCVSFYCSLPLKENAYIHTHIRARKSHIKRFFWSYVGIFRVTLHTICIIIIHLAISFRSLCIKEVNHNSCITTWVNSISFEVFYFFYFLILLFS